MTFNSLLNINPAGLRRIRSSKCTLIHLEMLFTVNLWLMKWSVNLFFHFKHFRPQRLTNLQHEALTCSFIFIIVSFLMVIYILKTRERLKNPNELNEHQTTGQTVHWFIIREFMIHFYFTGYDLLLCSLVSSHCSFNYSY